MVCMWFGLMSWILLFQMVLHVNQNFIENIKGNLNENLIIMLHVYIDE